MFKSVIKKSFWFIYLGAIVATVVLMITNGVDPVVGPYLPFLIYTLYATAYAAIFYLVLFFLQHLFERSAYIIGLNTVGFLGGFFLVFLAENSGNWYYLGLDGTNIALIFLLSGTIIAQVTIVKISQILNRG